MHTAADPGRGDGLQIVHVDALLNDLRDAHVRIDALRALRGGPGDAPRIVRGDLGNVLLAPRVVRILRVGDAESDH